MKHQLLFLALMAISSQTLPGYGHHGGHHGGYWGGGPSFGISIGGGPGYGYFGPGYYPGYYGYRRGPLDFVGDTIAGIATAEAIKDASRNSSRNSIAADNMARRSEIKRQIFNAQDKLEELEKKYGIDSSQAKEQQARIDKLETELRRA